MRRFSARTIAIAGIVLVLIFLIAGRSQADAGPGDTHFAKSEER
jgi:hypothetical protein